MNNKDKNKDQDMNSRGLFGRTYPPRSDQELEKAGLPIRRAGDTSQKEMSDRGLYNYPRQKKN